MTKYQNAVMWLGLALIFVRFLTTGQRSLLHNLLTVGGNQNLPPQNSSQNGNNAQPNPKPNAPATAPKTKPIGSRPVGVSKPQPNPQPNIIAL